MIKRNTSALGIDLSDRTFNYCVMAVPGGVVEEGKRNLTAKLLEEVWSRHAVEVVVLEAGTPSSWVSEHLASLGARVIVADPRKLQAVTADVRKSDKRDARMLARLGLADEELLAPTYVRPAEHRRSMSLLRVRDQQVRARTATILEIRSQVKLAGARLPSSTTPAFEQLEEYVPEELRPILAPAFSTVRAITASIRALDEQLVSIGKTSESVKRLAKVHGVGPVTAVAFVAVVGDPARFTHTRDIGAYLGLVPRRAQSGEGDPALRITKAGSAFLRRLLVQCATFLIGPLAQDCTLRRYGLKKLEAAGGGKAAKKKVVVAVARKLAVMLLSMWKQQAVWQRFSDTAAEERADAPQPVVRGECDDRSDGVDLVTETAPPPTTRTQSCTVAAPASSAYGSAGRRGPSKAPLREVAAASADARPATPSAPAPPACAGGPAGLASASSGQPRRKRGRSAAEGMSPSS